MSDRRPPEILLVEDSPDDVVLIQLALRSHDLGERVVVARDGIEALELLHGESRHEFAVVVLDLRLPRVGGHEVLRRLRADRRTRLLPVVVLSSSTEPDDVAASYEGGANSYVSKPTGFGELAATVAEIGRYWALLNVPVDGRER
jgi:two-component system response regulator